jgi:hypothetical protein
MAMAMGNLVLSIIGSGSGGRGYVCRKLSQKEDGGAGRMDKGGGGMDNETQGGRGGMQNQGRGRGGMAMGNLVLSFVGSGSEGRGFVCCKLQWKEDGGAGTMGKGGGGTDDEKQGGGGGTQK